MTEVAGSLRSLTATAGTTRPDEVWRLWTTPATWGSWDGGLRSARLDGPFRPGARGEVVDRRGRRARLTVAAVDPGRRCEVHVALPGARLRLTRTLGEEVGGTASVRHEVDVTGPLGLLWALVLGRGFRRLLGPAVDALVALAERCDADPPNPTRA